MKVTDRLRLGFLGRYWSHRIDKAAKLPEMAKNIIKAESAEAVASILHDAWLGYGVGDVKDASFAITFEKGSSLKTFDDAMKFLRYRIAKDGNDREYRMGRSPYIVEGTASEGKISLSVVEAAETEEE